MTFETPEASALLKDEPDVLWAYHPTTRNIPNLLRNARLAWKVLRGRRPEIVVSTGAGVALPFFILARIFRMTTVYIEVYDRVETPTLTGRLVRPFTSIMMVQWPEQQRLYRDAIVIGPLL
ncbi:MAG: UDP-N-acetylglucosamine--LPS N-acetylglucosamine transferase [Microbacterium sp.]|uniref:UDP-N-acetylglucosamine--LPS N-acetylglucosamine transferase n=1 Tax=Microbacterium sp. TaxID=51671 RepID=UPI0039E7174F